MDTFEYKIVPFRTDSGFEQEINREAEEGWRLVQAVSVNKAYLIFERDKTLSKSQTNPPRGSK
jgi:Domain of unknown function (DUF4177)